MALIHSHRSAEGTPQVDLDDDVNQKILESITAAGIDPEQSMVVGSAALALLGVRFPVDRETGKTRPGDVDLIASPRLMSGLHDAHETSTGVPVSLKHVTASQTVLRVDTPSTDASLLPIDLIHRPRGGFTLDKRHDKFMKHAHKSENGFIIPETNIRVASPKYVIRELGRRSSLESRSGDYKAGGDLAAFYRHYSGKI